MTQAVQLSPEGLALYQELLRRQLASGTELAEHLGVTPEAVGARLKELAAHQLITQIGPGAERWRPLPPGPGVSAVLSQLDDEMAVIRRRQDAIRTNLSTLRDLYEQHQARLPERGGGDLEVLRTGEEVRRRLHELSLLTTEEVLAMHPTMASREVLEEGQALDRVLLERRVRYRVIWPHSARQQAAVHSYLTALVSEGADIRTSSQIPCRMLVLDRAYAVVPMNDGSTGAAVVGGSFHVAFLTNLFEHCWAAAQPVQGLGYDDDVLEAIEIAILTDMANGRSDEAISRRLNVSTRTLRRYVSQISAKLGVETRFQLGLAAVRQGAINLPGEEGTGDAAPELNGQ